MGLRKFFNRQVNIRFIKASLAVLITVAFIFLLSFSAKIFNSFAENPEPIGDLLYSEVINSKKYDFYKNCVLIDGEIDGEISEFITSYDLTDTSKSDPESLMMYKYNLDIYFSGTFEYPNILILDGEGYIDELKYDDAYDLMANPRSYYTDCSTLIGFNLETSETLSGKIVCSNNGFKPQGSMAWYFYGFNATYFDATNFDTSEVTDMSHMFQESKFKEIKGIENFNVSKVTSFNKMFHSNGFSYIGELGYEKNMDLSRWDVSNATNFDYMFSYFTSNNINLNLSNWHIKTGSSMNYFLDYNYFSYLDLSDWVIEDYISAIYMFGCNGANVLDFENSKLKFNNDELNLLMLGNIETIILPTNFDVEVSDDEFAISPGIFVKFDPFSPTHDPTESSMYGYDVNGNLIENPVFSSLPVASGDLYKVRLSSNLTTDNCIYRTYDTVNKCVIRYFTDGIETDGVKDSTSLTVFDMSANSNGSIKAYLYSDGTLILDGNGNIKTASSFGYRNSSDNSSVKFVAISNNGFNPDSCENLFYRLSSLNKVDLGGLDTSNIINMKYMFASCTTLTSLDLSTFDTSNVTNMSYMFENCKLLKDLKFGTNFDTSKVEDMSYMFQECIGFKSLDLRNFDTRNVTSMKSMFDLCTKLESLNISNFDTSNVTNMDNMFNYCENLKTLTLPAHLITSVCTDCSALFSRCSSLESLDVSGFYTSNIGSMDNMFSNCETLTSLDLSNFNTSKVYTISHMIDNCNNLQTLNLSGLDLSHLSSSYTDNAKVFEKNTSLTKIYLPANVDEDKINLYGNGANTGKVWMGYNGDTPVPSKIYTKLPHIELDGENVVVDNIRLVEQTPIYQRIDDNGSPDDTSDDITYKYYVGGYTVDDGDLNTTNYYAFDISETGSAGSPMAYLYGDGMLVLEGAGSINTTENAVYRSSSFRDKIYYAATSVNGFAPNRFNRLFQNLSQLKSFDTTNLDLSNIDSNNAGTMYARMFENCTNLESVSFPEFDGTLTGNVATNNMFFGCTKLTSVSLPNLRGLTLNGLDNMFYACNSLTNIELPSAKYTGSLVDMFNSCYELKSASFENGAVTSGVTNINLMFNYCHKLKTVDFSNCDFSGLTNNSSPFTQCESIEKVILPKSVPTAVDISLPTNGKWVVYDIDDNVKYINPTKVVSATKEGDYISNVVLLYTYTDPVTGVVTKYYTNGHKVNDGELVPCTAFDITKTQSSPVGSCMAYLYGDGMLVLDGEGVVNEYYDNYYKNNTHKDNVNKAATSVNGFKPSSCKFLFYGLRNLESVDLSTLNCTNVSSYQQMFSGCSKLKSVSFPDSQSTKITSLSNMFNGCSKLESVDLKNLEGTIVDEEIQMFYGCESLKNITFPAVEFDTTNPQMTWMFGNCESLDSVIFADGIDTTAITNVASMFNGCKKLKTIDLSSWKFDNVIDGNDLFYNANAIEKVLLPESVPTTGDIPLPSSAKWVVYNNDDIVINSNPTKVVSYTNKGDYISNVALLYTYTYPDTLDVTKYYTNGHTVNDEEKIDIKYTISLSSDNSLKAYYYEDDTVVLDGNGNFIYNYNDSILNGYTSCKKIFTSDRGFKVTNTSLRCMFAKCSNTTIIDLTNLEANNVNNMSSMFSECSSLKTVIFGDKINLNNCDITYRMFYKCSSLEKLDLSKIVRTQSETSLDMGAMFYNCTSLKELNIENIYNNGDNSKYQEMFGEPGTGYFDENIEKLNIKNLDLSNLTSNTYFALVYNSGNTHQKMNLKEVVLPSAVSTVCPLELPAVPGYKWVGYLGDIQVPSKTYTYLPAREDGVVDTIKLVLEPPIYTDDLGTTDTSDDIKYYKTRTNKTSGADKIDFVKEYDISKETDGSLMAYLYSDGMLILDGTGNLFETNYSASTKVLMPYASDTANKSKITKVAFSDLGFTPDTCKGLFATLNNLSSIYNISKLNATSVTDYSYMFSDCTSLTNIDLSSLNFNNITDMSYMFSNCTSMVKNITWPSCVFANDVNMSHLFDGCSSLEEVDLSTFNMSNVTEDNHVIDVFKGCTKINKIILPIATREYYQTGVIDLPDPLHFNKYKADGNKYDDHVYLEILGRTNEGDYLGKDINKLLFIDTKGTPDDTSDDVKYYLYGDEETGILVDSVKEFCLDGNTVAIHYTDGMLILQGEGNINAGDYDCIVPSTSIMNSFKANTTKAACSNLGFKPDSLGKLFNGYDELESFDATYLVCTDVKSYQQMFDGCTSLKSAIFPNSHSTNKTKIYAMFNECKALENVDLKNLNGTTVKDAQEMFYNCDKLTSITFPSVTFGNDGTAARLSSAFNSCDLLESVTFADGINTTYVTDIRNMCSNCPKLEYVDFSNCDFSGLTQKGDIFSNSTAMEKVILPSAVPSSTSYDIPLPSSDTWVVFKEDGSVRDGSKQTKIVSYTNKGDYISNVVLLYTYTDSVSGKVTKYYTNGHKVNDGELVPCTAYDITNTENSSPGSCMAYYYNDGMLIFDGAGATQGYALNGLPWSGKTIYYIAISDNGFKPTNMSKLFSNTQIKTVENLDKFDASGVTLMNYLFYNCENLESINFPSTIASTINTSNFSGQSIEQMFSGCKNLKELDLSMFNTSKITCLYNTFSGCTNLQTLNLSGLDLSKLQSSLCNDVFTGDSSLNKIILPNTVADGVVDLPTKQGYVWMGYNEETQVPSKTYTKLPNIELDGESNVVVDTIRLVEAPLLYEYNDGTDNYKYYVGGYKKNNGSFNTNGYVKFDLSVSPSPANSICAYLYGDGMLVLDGEGNVNTGYGELFRSDSYNTKIKKAATSINGFIPDSCENLFDGLSSLTKVDLSTIDTSSSTSMRRMFYGCNALSSLDLSKFDTANVISMSSMFQGCTLLTSINLSSFNTLNVKDMSIMFNACVNLSSLILSSFNTTNVINMSNMFSSCTKLTTLTLGSNFKTNNVTSMYAMFSKCKMLSSIDVSNFNTSNVEDMSYMFEECNALNSINVLNFNTSSVKNMKYMFKNCNTLSELNVSSFDTSKVETIESMFDGCSNLTKLTLQINDNKLTTARNAISGLTKLQTLDLRGSVFNKNITNYLYVAGLTNVSKIYIPKTVDGGAVNLMNLPSGKSWVLFNIDGSAASSSLQTYLTGYSSDGVDTSKAGMYLGLGIPIDLATASFPDVTYNGAMQTPNFTLTYNSTPLVLDTDYEIVEWGNNTNAGLSTDTNAPYVKIKGKGTYAGDATFKFTIAKKGLEIDLNNAISNQVLNVTDTKTYDGDNKAKLSGSDTFSINYPTGVIVSSNEQTIKINLKGTFDSKDVDATKVTYEITSLSDGDNGGLISNYNVTYKDNVSVNDNKFERVGTITPFEITMSWPTSLQVSKSYDGDNKVKFDDGSGNLVETKSHSITGVNSETVHVLISGTYTSGSASGNNLSYTLSAILDTSDTYKAVNKNYVLSNISKTKNGNDGVISSLSFTDETRFNITNNFVTPIEYDGQIHKVSISDFVITLDGTALDNISDDFEIVFDSDSYNYIDAGTYNYKLKAKETGKYSGEIPFSYTITPKVINVTDIVLDPYSSTNLLTKEYDGNKDFVIKEGMITPSLKYHFNDDVTLTLNYSKGEYSDSNKDNTIAIKASNGGNASTKDLVFSNITLDSSSNTGINLNNFVLNSSDDFSSITFSNCGQILDTISPVITDVSFDKTTIGKNGTLEITLTFSEDLVHDFESYGEELNNKFYIELNSLLGVTPSVNYGKAYIDLVKMESCDHNKLIFKYLLPNEYNDGDGYLVEGLSGAIHKDNINVSDDCDNQIDTAFNSELQTNKFGTLVINTQGIVVNIKAYSDSTYDESKLLDTSKNTDLLTIYYEFIFEDSVNDFDESDIKVKINGMDKEITSGLTKVNNKVYRIAISNAGYLSADDTDGIILMSVSLPKGCAHDANSNDTISQSLELNIERNLIIKDETVLQDIPGVTNKVFAKVADYTSKLSYKVFKYFDSLMQESDEVKSSDGLLITTHEVTNNGIKLVLDVTAKLNEYKTKVTQFSYVVKTNDHIAKEIINNVIPTSDSTKDENIKNIILDPDNEEILELDSDVKTIINNPSNTDVHDAIVEALKDLIEKENVHGLNDSDKIKDKLKDVISDIARLVDPSNTHGLNFIIDESINPEERMISYQKLTAIQKEYLDKHYRIDIDKLYIAYKDYVTFNDTKENETIEKFDDTEEIEIYGVIDRIDNTLTEDDIRTLSVEKIKDEDRLTNINTTLENEGKLTGKKVIIPYDIKLLVNGTPVTDNTNQNMLIKLSLPQEFYNAVFEIYHLKNDNTFGEQIEIEKQIYNDECLIFFEANSFSPYIPVSNLRTVLVRTNDDALGTACPKGLSAVDVGTNKNITITPNQGYYANVLENGVKVKEKFRGTYTLTNIQDNKEIYVEFVKDEEPQKPTEPEKPSITNATVITIQTANHMPYINGYSDKTFRPNNAMTRAEFTKVISTISNNFNLSYDNDKYITKYKDVKEDSWYSNYVGYVTKLGLMKGYSDGTFKPNNYITRAEVSKVLSDMFNVPDKQIENIFFNELNGHWYFNSTNELIKGGVIKGYKDGTFKPNKNVTRAEVISLINRVKDREIDKDIDKGYLNMMDSKFKDVSKSNWFYNDLVEASIAHNSFDLH